MAIQRLSCLEKRMKRDPSLSSNIGKQIKDYVKKGYARKLSIEEAARTTSRTWYLPLFAVTNPNKPGKVRMVWDAAATVNGVSLNSMLLKGPDLLTPLPEVLFRFRERAVAVCGDIKEMFHQILILEKDRDSQRFLWRENEADETTIYEMCVMTFGSTCSPSSAQYVKNRNADEYANNYPRGAAEIKHNHYVDDWLGSFSSEKEAADVAKEVQYIHSQAGFEMRNWISNSDKVLKSLGVISQDDSKNLNIGKELAESKVLGLWWATNEDTLFFAINLGRMDTDLLNGRRKPTKREVLKILMMIYDPLGLIACVLVHMKILLQEIWRSAIGWDEHIKDDQMTKWLKWTKSLKSLENIRIQRCYSPLLSLDKQPPVDLHVFVDASENAYAAVAYFRIQGKQNVECILISAKTKVAPQKPLSIPRLELQAAVLGVRLAQHVMKSHSIMVKNRIFWSDSSNVLSWIRSTQRKYVTFVALRIGEILDVTEINEWRWVPTKENIADEATKWTDHEKTILSTQWFGGPEFLRLPSSEWPVEKIQYQSEIDLEIRGHYTHVSTKDPNTSPDPTRITQWRILVRTQVIILRVINNGQKKNKAKTGALSADELNEAEFELYRTAQYQSYKDEVQTLKINPIGSIDKSSTLYNMCPFLDDNSILRMRGRLKYAPHISDDTRNPILLPPNNAITDLLLASYHRRYHHYHYETAINEIRQKYWVPKLRVKMKKIRAYCQKCKNEKATPVAPMMADHPIRRLSSFTRPFSFVGLDYFGPMEVVIGRRHEKRWGALFTCLTIRAVHIEIASNLTTDSAIMCIRNFIARRGTPIEIWSENSKTWTTDTLPTTSIE